MLQNSGEKGYLAKFWPKSVISQESGRNLVIEQDFGEKLLSCKILRDWTDILQDPDKKVSLENSDRKNDYLALICRKKVTCKILAEWKGILQDLDKNGYLAVLWRKMVTCKILAEIVILQYSGWMNFYLTRFWRKKLLSSKFLAKKVSFRKNQVEIWLLSKILAENSYLVRFWQNERVSCKTLTKIVILEISDRKNDYFALICLKTVSLLDSGRRMFTL